MYQNDPTRVLTPECRLSYCHLVQPYVRPEDKDSKDPKYSVTLLIPKTPEIKAELDAAMKAAEERAVQNLWNGARPQYASVVWDGDGYRRSGDPFPAECKGCYVVTASTNTKPYCCGADNVNCELAPQDIYSGMYARVSINFYGFAASGNRGVACGLRGVMKTRDGEPLSAAVVTASEFAGVGNAPSSGQRINPITGQPM